MAEIPSQKFLSAVENVIAKIPPFFLQWLLANAHRPVAPLAPTAVPHPFSHRPGDPGSPCPSGECVARVRGKNSWPGDPWGRARTDRGPREQHADRGGRHADKDGEEGVQAGMQTSGGRGHADMQNAGRPEHAERGTEAGVEHAEGDRAKLVRDKLGKLARLVRNVGAGEVLRGRGYEARAQICREFGEAVFCLFIFKKKRKEIGMGGRVWGGIPRSQTRTVSTGAWTHFPVFSSSDVRHKKEE